MSAPRISELYGYFKICYSKNLTVSEKALNGYNKDMLISV
ncbi:protein of unknown function [Ruminococcaceae bacterium BL-6]|nr:protein of unknown function [Ruminococcaceae bacterium BL-6]